MIRKIITLIILSAVFSATAFCQSNELLTNKNRLKFGDYLLRQKDYLRAVNEYRSILKNVKNDTVKFKLAFCLEKMKRYQEAADNYKGLIFNSNLEELSKIYFLRNKFLSVPLKDYRSFTKNRMYESAKYRDKSNKLQKLSLLLDFNRLPEKDKFLSDFDKQDRETISGFYNRRVNPEHKDPLTAGILSALVPGAGKFYTEEYTDGLTSFLLTGVLTYLAIDNLNDGHDTRGWIFTGLATYFYAGNIYGSVASAQIFNARVEFNLVEEIKQFLGKKNHFLPEVRFIQ